MPVSRTSAKTNNKKQLLKQKLVNFKNQKQERIMENRSNQLPKVRQYPVWNSTDRIEVNGAELQAIATFMDNSTGAVMAYQNIINRGLIDGVIKLKYEKLNDDATAYEPMNEEESAPYQAEFQSLVKQAKDIAEQSVKATKEEMDLAASQEGLPAIDAVVDATGQPAQAKIITL